MVKMAAQVGAHKEERAFVLESDVELPVIYPQPQIPNILTKNNPAATGDVERHTRPSARQSLMQPWPPSQVARDKGDSQEAEHQDGVQ